MQKFAESVAPGQGKQLFDKLNAESSSDDDEHSIPDDIMPFLNAYDHSDKKGKLIILSQLDHSIYIKQQIQTFLVCSKHYIDKARALNIF